MYQQRNNNGASVKIIGVELDESAEGLVRHFVIDQPQPSTAWPSHLFEVEGWVVGKASPVVAVELVHADALLRQTLIRVPRPDVFAAIPGLSGSPRCGFWTALGTLGLADSFEVRMDVRFADDTSATVARIRGLQRRLSTGFRPTINPILVTSLGRTGTTWLMRLLAGHPDIVVHPVAPHEMRAAAYWMHTLKILAEPADRLQSAQPELFHGQISWTGHHPFYHAEPMRDQAPVIDRQLDLWFSDAYVRSAASFCQASIDGFYRQVADTLGVPGATFFAEKNPQAGHVPWLIWNLYPGAREIFLVRDFRDMFVSMEEFNRKRGAQAFGREECADTEAFLAKLRCNARRLLEDWRCRKDRAFLVRYEDLVASPRTVLKALLKYLGVATDEATLSSTIANAKEDPIELAEHRTSSTLEASVGRWRRELSEAQRASCQGAFADLLAEAGYPP